MFHQGFRKQRSIQVDQSGDPFFFRFSREKKSPSSAQEVGAKRDSLLLLLLTKVYRIDLLWPNKFGKFSSSKVEGASFTLSWLLINVRAKRNLQAFTLAFHWAYTTILHDFLLKDTRKFIHCFYFGLLAVDFPLKDT